MGQLFRPLLEPEVLQQLFSADAAVRIFAQRKCQRAARTHDRVEQPPGGNSVAKFQPVGHQLLDAQVPCQRPHHMIESLAHQHHLPVLFHPLAQHLQPFGFELRLQNVVEVFLPQQVQPIASHSAQQRVQNARGQNAVARVQHRPHQRLQKQSAAPRPALRERMRVPGEIRYRPHRGQIRQAAFDPPENRPAISRACVLRPNFALGAYVHACASRAFRRKSITVLRVRFAQVQFPAQRRDCAFKDGRMPMQ